MGKPIGILEGAFVVAADGEALRNLIGTYGMYPGSRPVGTYGSCTGIAGGTAEGTAVDSGIGNVSAVVDGAAGDPVGAFASTTPGTTEGTAIGSANGLGFGPHVSGLGGALFGEVVGIVFCFWRRKKRQGLE